MHKSSDQHLYKLYESYCGKTIIDGQSCITINFKLYNDLMSFPFLGRPPRAEQPHHQREVIILLLAYASTIINRLISCRTRFGHSGCCSKHRLRFRRSWERKKPRSGTNQRQNYTHSFKNPMLIAFRKLQRTWYVHKSTFPQACCTEVRWNCNGPGAKSMYTLYGRYALSVHRYSVHAKAPPQNKSWHVACLSSG